LTRMGGEGHGWPALTGPAPVDRVPGAAVLARLHTEAADGDRPRPRVHRLGRPDGAARAGWRGRVLAALEAIGEGRLDKVVLSREATVAAEGRWPRAEVLRRLRRRP